MLFLFEDPALGVYSIKISKFLVFICQKLLNGTSWRVELNTEKYAQKANNSLKKFLKLLKKI